MGYISVAICEDDLGQHDCIESHVRTLAAALSFDIRIEHFFSGEELLKRYPDNLDFLFLDIKMDGIDGIEAALHVRDIDTTVSIVFMTNHMQYAIQGYKAQAYRYLLKPVSYMQFKEELEAAFVRCEYEQNAVIYVSSNRNRYRVPIRNILFVETTNKKACVFHLIDEDIVSYTTLTQCEKYLHERGFFRCHASYLINMSMIKTVLKESVLMLDGNDIPVSKHRKKDFMKTLSSFTARSVS